MWWELRIRVDADEYEEFTDSLFKLMRASVGARPDVGVEASREDREAVISAKSKGELGAALMWAFQCYSSAQINLTARCYRSTDRPELNPGSPWVQRCECPPDAHPAQNPYPPGKLFLI